MPYHPFTQSFEQLPKVLPIFPLSGAVVLPGGSLPLNIFEPRYLNMVQDAMRSNQIIGMIQPKDDSPTPSLYSVGCAGRIRRYEEVDGGRLEIEIAGLCRFKVEQELESVRGYRIVKANWEHYSNDYTVDKQTSSSDHQPLIRSLKRYFNSKNLDTDWDTIEKIDQIQLVNNLLGYLPLTPEDKQLLIEADNDSERLRFFIAILDRENLSGSDIRH